jgi:Polyketide cyclase / dehydrase and lipid transport
VLSYSARSAAPLAAAWRLVARPQRWHEWAPHLRGAWGLGTREVRVGALVAARVPGVVPVPARVTAKEPERSWSWRVGPVEIVHHVEPQPASGGSLVAVDLSAPAPIERALAVTYGPLVALLVRNLARVAERSS